MPVEDKGVASVKSVFKKNLATRFDDEIKFFSGWKANKKAVGAIAPTSSRTARKMASIVDTSSGLPVLELGAGTGVITDAILKSGVRPEQLVSVEYSQIFYHHLVKSFANVDFRCGDAFDLDRTLGEKQGAIFDCVICAVPLLNFPMAKRISLIEDLLKRVPIGRPVLQITYGLLSPVVAMPERYEVRHFGFVMRNIPPAQLWAYRKPG